MVSSAQQGHSACGARFRRSRRGSMQKTCSHREGLVHAIIAVDGLSSRHGQACRRVIKVLVTRRQAWWVSCCKSTFHGAPVLSIIRRTRITAINSTEHGVQAITMAELQIREVDLGLDPGLVSDSALRNRQTTWPYSCHTRRRLHMDRCRLGFVVRSQIARFGHSVVADHNHTLSSECSPG